MLPEFNKIMMTAQQPFAYTVDWDKLWIKIRLFEYRTAGRSEHQLISMLAKEIPTNYADDLFSGICIGGISPAAVIQETWLRFKADIESGILNSEDKMKLIFDYEDRAAIEYDLKNWIEYGDDIIINP